METSPIAQEAAVGTADQELELVEAADSVTTEEWADTRNDAAVVDAADATEAASPTPDQAERGRRHGGAVLAALFVGSGIVSGHSGNAPYSGGL